MSKEKTKDNIKARKDLELYCRWPQLHLIESNGQTFKPKAFYCLSKEQKKCVCAWVKQLRLPDGFASNIAHYVNEAQSQLYGMKSHDCHVFMQRLLPIAFRGLLPNSIWDVITELSHFFRDICSTENHFEHMILFEGNIIETICKMEKIFPPGFFDSMEHLPIHLPYEAKVGGPVQYRWMYLFERFLHHIKKKVKILACVEGSICEAYVIEEISFFCSSYFEPNVETT
ncbi:uncharacterized protein LOC120263060 [Dioscorea cayenensis subsp. rotundata]|uniref:Uncharacterized protein LOC120263060 n=1 Tax=Dioscorea cayennensis subsp. rotundata TaxID=55577 RepID=A0AB40BJW7_DIOCR|nr:uncharacterized protein LOC120263060 [Dioscorea cayenensis subsp. rotundata]